jgi:hypothetical protein
MASSSHPIQADNFLVQAFDNGPDSLPYGDSVDIYAIKRVRDDTSNTSKPTRKRATKSAGQVINPPPVMANNFKPYNPGIGPSTVPPVQLRPDITSYMNPQTILRPQMQQNVQSPPPPKPTPRKKRTPLKKRQVEPERESDIWDKLDNVNLSMTMKDWIVHDKNARSQLREGLRYIDSRSTVRAGKRPARGSAVGSSIDNPMVMTNMIFERDSSGADDTDTYDDTTASVDGSDYYYDNENSAYDSGDESVSSTSPASASSDDDDDTLYEYPYQKANMTAHTPMTVMGTINGTAVKLIVDTGAMCSVITKSIAMQLGLLPNGDSVYISTIDTPVGQRPSNQCGVTVAVPVRVGNKLRPEHMLIKDDSQSILKEPVILLGITWLKHYGIDVRMKESLLEIPIKNGTASIMVQGFTDKSLCDIVLSTLSDMQYNPAPDPNSAEVFAVSVSLADEGESVHQDIVSNTACIYHVEVSDMADEGVRDNPVHVSNGDISALGNSVDLKDYIDEVLSLDDDLHDEGQVNGTEDPFESRLKSLPMGLANLLRKRKLQFAEFGGLGCVKDAEHRIQLKPGATPVRSRPYRLTWQEDEYLKREIEAMLNMGIIKPSSGTWTSPIFFIKKKGSTELRLVYDLRALNQRTITEDYPLPNIHDLLDGFHGCKYFSVLDAASGFTQIKLAEESMEYTSFVCKYGVFKHTRMPFGCQGGPASYSRIMAKILGPYIGVCFQIFIDDICCYSRTYEEHLEHLKLLFNLCAEYNLKLKWAKCEFAKSSVEYLGHRIDRNGISPTDKNIEKIKNLQVPNNASMCKSFLATVGFYRRMVPNFAGIAVPITQLLKKNIKFFWNEEQDAAYSRLKQILCQAPVISYPDFNQVQILTTDGSTKALGVILSQSPAGSSEGETVIAYGSRTLRGPETKYSATHVEAFAVVFGVKYFRHYLAGKRFLLRTDHSALKFIFNNKTPTPKIHRWAASLMGYEYDIQYIQGANNPADSLSRLTPVIDEM